MMSRFREGWYFVDDRKHTMLLVFEVVVERSGYVGVKVVARILDGRYEPVELAQSGCKFLANMIMAGRRVCGVKRLGNARDYRDMGVKMRERRAIHTSPRRGGNMGVGSPGVNGSAIIPNSSDSSSSGGLSPTGFLFSGSSSDSNSSWEPLKLAYDADDTKTLAWLRARGFGDVEDAFAGYSAADIRSLSKEDLIQICGVAAGIRLFNALTYKPPKPKLTLYFNIEGGESAVWRVVYMDTLTSSALAGKLVATFNLVNQRIHSILLKGPQGINVMVSDEVVANMSNESTYLVENIRVADPLGEYYNVLLRPFTR